MDPSGLVFLYMNTEILTNGVSFSLVAGACCVVAFSNNVGYDPSSVTLNINSTGAKKFTGWWRYSQDAGGQYQYLSFYGLPIVCYNGTAYIHCGPWWYGDYQD